MRFYIDERGGCIAVRYKLADNEDDTGNYLKNGTLPKQKGGLLKKNGSKKKKVEKKKGRKTKRKTYTKKKKGNSKKHKKKTKVKRNTRNTIATPAQRPNFLFNFRQSFSRGYSGAGGPLL